MNFHDRLQFLENPIHKEVVMSEVREKFATQVDAALLNQLRELAKNEGRQIQALVDEALADLLE